MKMERYTAEELKAMLPYIAAADGIVAAVAVVIGIFFGFDWRAFSGLIVGNLLMLANFVLIGVTVDKTIKCRDFRRARKISGISYGLRYIGMFAVLALLLTFDLIAVATAVIPLFYPKIYYTFIYTLTRGKDDG